MRIGNASRIAAMRANGHSWAKIAAHLNVGEGTVYRAARAITKNPKGN
jgi:transposase